MCFLIMLTIVLSCASVEPTAESDGFRNTAAVGGIPCTSVFTVSPTIPEIPDRNTKLSNGTAPLIRSAD